MNWEEAYGIKISVVVSGIVGGIISLTYEQRISFLKALIMIFTGGATTALTYPALEAYFSINPAFANAVGFFLGLIAMRLIDVTLSLVDKIKSNPVLLLHLFNPSKYGELFSVPKPSARTTDTVDNSVHAAGDTTEASKKELSDSKDIRFL